MGLGLEREQEVPEQVLVVTADWVSREFEASRRGELLVDHSEGTPHISRRSQKVEKG